MERGGTVPVVLLSYYASNPMEQLVPNNPPSESPSGQLLIFRDGATQLQVRLDGQTVWLSRIQIAELYQTTPQNITMHISAIYDEGELSEPATSKDYLLVQNEAGRQVRRSLLHYSLDMILAIGYRVRSQRGTAFRQWATARLSELLVKGFTMDDERIKAGRTIGADYFDELLARIRDIRSSERLFYQKITDLYATSIDYDSKADVTKRFFQAVQNKLHYAAHGQTAAEVVASRADAQKPNMGLTTWKNAPEGPVRKADVSVAKNCLTKSELEQLNLMVSAWLDFAELQARSRRPMHMADWASKLDDFLRVAGTDVLTNLGHVSQEVAKAKAEQEFAAYDSARRELTASTPSSDFDRQLEELKQLESQRLKASKQGKRAKKPPE